MSLVWRVTEADFEWGDLPPDEEAARFAAKASNAYGGNLPGDLVIEHYRGSRYSPIQRDIPPTMVEKVPWPITRQFGVRNLGTNVETWGPPGVEGPTRPDITVGVVRDLCGIVAIEQKVTSLEAQVRALQGQMAQRQPVYVREPL